MPRYALPRHFRVHSTFHTIHLVLLTVPRRNTAEVNTGTFEYHTGVYTHVHASAHRYHTTAPPAVFTQRITLFDESSVNEHFWRTWIVAIPPQPHVSPPQQ